MWKDPEKRRAYGREWMKRNPEKAREAMRRWRERHPEEFRRRTKVYRALNPEKKKAWDASYAAGHPDKKREIRARRRARVANAEGTYTEAEWLALIAMYEGRCAYCGAAGTLQPDHRVPLSRGGSNWIDNIIPACAHCNQRKHVRTEDEFRAWRIDHPDDRSISEEDVPYTWGMPAAG